MFKHKLMLIINPRYRSAAQQVEKAKKLLLTLSAAGSISTVRR